MSLAFRRSTPGDVPQICEFWREHWGGEFVVAHGKVYRPDGLAGFIALDGDQWVGLVTYQVLDRECEIVSLDSLREGEGIGSRLIEKVLEEAQRAGCARLFLVTTNDNLHALGFYQKRGFKLVRVNREALEASRKIKPAIPLIGLHGIPLRDEIELEIAFV